MRFNMKNVMFAVCLGCLWTGIQVVSAGNAVVYLDDFAVPEDWRVSGAVVSISESIEADGRPTLHFYTPIETTDETLAAATWPKFWRAVQSNMDVIWTEYDRFEFLILGDFVPANVVPLKSIAFQLFMPNANHAYSQAISFEQLGVWRRVSIPIDTLEQLDQLSAIQFHFGKHRFRGIKHADFYIGGFRLVREDVASLRRPVLLTPRASLLQPQLIMERATVDPSMQFAIHANGEMYPVETQASTPENSIQIDLSSLIFPPGNHRLVALWDEVVVHEMSFDWLPFMMTEVDLGDMMVGTNLASVTLTSASPDEQMITVSIQTEGVTLARERMILPAQSKHTILLPWQMEVGSRGSVAIRVQLGEKLVEEVSLPIEQTNVFFMLPEHQAIYAQSGKPTFFRVPVYLAKGSRKNAALQWRLLDASGQVQDEGISALEGATAGITTELNDGRYTLEMELIWDGEHRIQTNATVWFVQGI